MMLTRQQLLEALIAALQPLPEVNAMWEGGSAAFGRVDEYSDLDVVCDVAQGQVDGVFTEIERCLESLSPISRRYVLPLPTWHGHAQRFYQLQDADEHLMLDVVLMEHLQGPRFMELEQHGLPVVYFDKCAAVVPEHVDRAAWQAKIDARLAELQAMYPMFQSLVRKELRRGRELDALHFYHGLTLRPLIELLRMRYDPYRFTFGMRYLNFDLPPAEVERLRPLCFVADAAALELAQRAAESWALALLAELQRDGIQL